MITSSKGNVQRRVCITNGNNRAKTLKLKTFPNEKWVKPNVKALNPSLHYGSLYPVYFKTFG